MNTLYAVLCAAMIGVGALLIGLEFTRRTDTVKPRRAAAPLADRIRKRFGPRGLAWLIIGVVGGILLTVQTGWLVFLIAAPAAALFIPPLFTDHEEQDRLNKLNALEAWSRNLSGLISTGATSLNQAIITSLPNTPAPIQSEVKRLVARLDARWSPAKAFRAFADDIDDPTGDLLTAHLILATSIRVSALPDALEDLAQTIFEEVRTRREITASRESARTTVKWVTLITVLVITAGALFAGDFFSFYTTPVGQLVLCAIVGLYAAALRWMHSISRVKLPPRIIGEGAK